MSQERYKHIRESLFDYINAFLINKYDELYYFNMYESAENMNWDVEYIFKLKYSLTFHEKKNLEIRIRKDLKKFLKEKFEMNIYELAILIILEDNELHSKI